MVRRVGVCNESYQSILTSEELEQDPVSLLRTLFDRDSAYSVRGSVPPTTVSQRRRGWNSASAARGLWVTFPANRRTWSTPFVPVKTGSSM